MEIPCDEGMLFNKEVNKQHILYSGTQLLQVRGGQELKALVINTG